MTRRFWWGYPIALKYCIYKFPMENLPRKISYKSKKTALNSTKKKFGFVTSKNITKNIKNILYFYTFNVCKCNIIRDDIILTSNGFCRPASRQETSSCVTAPRAAISAVSSNARVHAVCVRPLVLPATDSVPPFTQLELTRIVVLWFVLAKGIWCA